MSVTVAQAGTIDSGEEPYERCALCHGLFGVSAHPKFPNLAGQNALYLTAQIEAFINGNRVNDGGQMRNIVTEISATEIEQVVAWFSAQEPAAAVEIDNSDGAKLFDEAGCAQCHVENLAEDEMVPLLHAQHKDYLAKQMRDYRDGNRLGETPDHIESLLKRWTDSEIEAVAMHLASQARSQ